MNEDQIQRRRDLLAHLVKTEAGRLGLAQAELAKRSGLSRSTIQRLEKGQPVKKLKRLDDALGWPPGQAQSILDFDEVEKIMPPVATVIFDELAKVREEQQRQWSEIDRLARLAEARRARNERKAES